MSDEEIIINDVMNISISYSYITGEWQCKNDSYNNDINNDGIYNFAQSYLTQEPIDYFIFGHRHQMVDKQLAENSRFVLLGDWIKNFSYGVFDGEKFELKTYKDIAESQEVGLK